jgi:hypothetical protein
MFNLDTVSDPTDLPTKKLSIDILKEVVEAKTRRLFAWSCFEPRTDIDTEIMTALATMF